jgi:NADPH:quinone reductase-like Zn-dependent oxidoreductase
LPDLDVHNDAGFVTKKGNNIEKLLHVYLRANTQPTMKAILCESYGPPEVLKLGEVEKPIPKANELLIRVRATTVTVADSRIRAFRVPKSFWIPARLALGITKPRQPILGAELAGDVEEVGKDVKRFKKGDEVFAATLFRAGAYAEYISLPEDGPVAIRPANVTYEEAAAIPIGARTALRYLKAAGVGNGTKVLIYGASGSVGTYAVQLARHYGAEVTGVCGSRNLDLVRSIGAHKVIDYSIPGLARKLEMYDVICDAVDKLDFSLAIRHVKDNGVYMNVTMPFKSLAMMWTAATTKKRVKVGENIPEKAEDLAELKGLVEAGVLKPVMDRIYRFEQIVEAHRYVDKGHKKGNVAITV